MPASALATIDRDAARFRRLLARHDVYLTRLDHAALTASERSRIAEQEAALRLGLRLCEIESDAILWRLFHYI